MILQKLIFAFLKFLLIIRILFVPPPALFGQNDSYKLPSSVWKRSTLTGTWGGYRNKLDASGIHFEAYYTGDVVSNLSGGLRQKTEYLDNIELKLILDAQKILGWPGAKFLIYGLGNNGGFPSQYVGDVQGVNNIEAFNTWKVYEAWLQQNFLLNRISLLFGLYDINSEFDFMQSASLFLNSSHGMGAEFAVSGLIGPPTFPLTSVGFRLKVVPKNSLYFQTVVLDGVPGNPDNPRGTQIVFKKEDGLLLAAEAGYLIDGTKDESVEPDSQTRARRKHIGREVSANYKAKIALGVWGYTSDFVNVDYQSIQRNFNASKDRGLYFLFDLNLQRKVNDIERGLSLFARIGFTHGNVNRFSSYTGGGIVYKAMLAGRPEDELGLAISAAHNNDNFKSNTQPFDHSEVTLELTWRIQISPWLAMQPDLQYVINPDTNPIQKNAFVLSTRAELTL